VCDASTTPRVAAECGAAGASELRTVHAFYESGDASRAADPPSGAVP
jgi:hypothetical protein